MGTPRVTACRFQDMIPVGVGGPCPDSEAFSKKGWGWGAVGRRSRWIILGSRCLCSAGSSFLTRFVRRLVRGDQIPEDIVQQTMLKALANADQFHFESAVTMANFYRDQRGASGLPLLLEVARFR
jgi:hypothetical protein